MFSAIGYMISMIGDILSVLTTIIIVGFFIRTIVRNELKSSKKAINDG